MSARKRRHAFHGASTSSPRSGTYRFLGAALAAAGQDEPATAYFADLPAADPLAPPEPTSADIRKWALGEGLAVSDRGRVPREVECAFRKAHDLTL